MKAMILAAGLGTRLRPLTLERAKPAVPLLGKPLVIRLLEMLSAHGATDFRLNLHHLPDTIERIFQSSECSHFNVSFSYEPEILGTAGGLKDNESFFHDETFMMANADIVADFPLHEAIAFHAERNAFATLILYPQRPPFEHLPVRIDQHYKLHNFKGHSSTGKPTPDAYVFTGIHILDAEIFDFIPSGRFYEINDQVYPEALRKGKEIYGFPVQGYWNDLGDPARYLRAHWDLFRLSGCNSPTYVSSDAHVHPTAKLGPQASIETGCILEENTSLENAVLWEKVALKRGAIVNNCIIGSDMIIDRRCEGKIITRNGEIPLE